MQRRLEPQLQNSATDSFSFEDPNAVLNMSVSGNQDPNGGLSEIPIVVGPRYTNQASSEQG